MPVVLTPTGGRPESLARLAGYLNAQDCGGFRWRILDDCDPESPVPAMRADITVETIRPEWRWCPGMNTQAAAMLRLLDGIGPADWVVIAEDDDAYLPGHIRTMTEALAWHQLAGQRTSLYYNVATRRYRELRGTYHASLGATALHGEAVEVLRGICRRQTDRLDLTLWRDFTGRKVLLDTRTAVGIKGLPGRAGIGCGHRDSFGIPDSGDTLREWIGDKNAEAYLENREP